MSSKDAENKNEDEKQDTYKTANTDWVLGARQQSLGGHNLVLQQSGQSSLAQICLEMLMNFFSK